LRRALAVGVGKGEGVATDAAIILASSQFPRKAGTRRPPSHRHTHRPYLDPAADRERRRVQLDQAADLDADPDNNATPSRMKRDAADAHIREVDQHAAARMDGIAAVHSIFRRRGAAEKVGLIAVPMVAGRFPAIFADMVFSLIGAEPGEFEKSVIVGIKVIDAGMKRVEMRIDFGVFRSFVPYDPIRVARLIQIGSARSRVKLPHSAKNNAARAEPGRFFKIE